MFRHHYDGKWYRNDSEWAVSQEHGSHTVDRGLKSTKGESIVDVSVMGSLYPLTCGSPKFTESSIHAVSQKFTVTIHQSESVRRESQNSRSNSEAKL